MTLNYDEIVGNMKNIFSRHIPASPLPVRSARGALVTDVDGKEYIDCGGG